MRPPSDRRPPSRSRIKREGLPVGSGATEATCKNLFKVRLKRWGRWHEDRLSRRPTRALTLSDRWDTRGTDTDDAAAFVIEDANCVSARWPGDAYLFAKKLLARVRA